MADDKGIRRARGGGGAVTAAVSNAKGHLLLHLHTVVVPLTSLPPSSYSCSCIMVIAYHPHRVTLACCSSSCTVSIKFLLSTSLFSCLLCLPFYHPHHSIAPTVSSSWLCHPDDGPYACYIIALSGTILMFVYNHGCTIRITAPCLLHSCSCTLPIFLLLPS